MTQVEIVSQAEHSGWDYADERVVLGPRDERSITLAHNYEGGRLTVTQIVQFGGTEWFIHPYAGAGAGIESQATRDSWYEGSVSLLWPGLRTVNEFPTDLPSEETSHTILFGTAGIKVFFGRHAYVLVDAKLTNRTSVLGRLGFGVELP